MEKSFNLKKFILVTSLILIAVLSVFVISPLASSIKFHSNSIKLLDEKKITVMELTAATVGSATALAAIPGDATTPIANQILKMSSYLIIVIGAIFLEKILLTLTGYVAFSFLVPIACLLFIIYLFVKKDILRNLSVKLAVFGIVLFLVVPISIKVSNLIELSYKDSINQTMEEAKNTEDNANEYTEEENKEKNGWNEITSKIKDGISNIGNSASKAVKNGEELLSKFIDSIALLLITSCVIPIVVLLIFVWIVKIIFNVNIPIQKSNKDKVKKQNKSQ